jgi:ubiquinone biosynthesis protein
MIVATRHILRLIIVARVLAQYDALFPLDDLIRPPPPVRLARVLAKLRLPWERRPAVARNARPGQRLAAALRSLGPTYIKLGQFLATRPDLTGEQVALDMAELQDRLPPFPEPIARRIIAEELGRAVEMLFLDFGPPVAAASIAQVHPALIPADIVPPDANRSAAESPLSDGVLTAQRVAVKVLRPGIEKAFARDLDGFLWLAGMVQRRQPALRRLRPVEVVQTMIDSIRMEMDLRLEAAAASEFAENTAEDPGFYVPAVDWQRTSERVLTLEWVDGIPISDRAALLAAGYDPRELATRLLQSFLTHAMRDGFFHADMHPGNLFVDRAGRLVAVDFGIMGRLDRATRRFLAEILRGFLMRDYEHVAEIHFEAEYVPRSQSRGAFAQALRAVGEPIFGRSAQEISMGRVLAQLFRVTEQFDMQTQPQLLLLQKTMVVVEGVARHLDPEANIWDISRPVIETWMIANLGPEARLREALGYVELMLRALPDAADLIEEASEATELRKGIRIHPDNIRELVDEFHREVLPQRIAFWVIALAMLAWIVLGFFPEH